jgi:hypothetical protein
MMYVYLYGIKTFEFQGEIYKILPFAGQFEERRNRKSNLKVISYSASNL